MSYTKYLEDIDNGTIPNINILAPKIAIEYWKLPKGATLRDVVIALRNYEAIHRDVNHNFTNILTSEKIREDYDY